MNNSIKVFRAKKNMTQEQLAKLVGVSRQTINSIEKNRYTPSVEIAMKISLVLDGRVEDLFTLDD